MRMTFGGMVFVGVIKDKRRIIILGMTLHGMMPRGGIPGVILLGTHMSGSEVCYHEEAHGR